jgi:hypothetical protein
MRGGTTRSWEKIKIKLFLIGLQIELQTYFLAPPYRYC